MIIAIMLACAAAVYTTEVFGIKRLARIGRLPAADPRTDSFVWILLRGAEAATAAFVIFESGTELRFMWLVLTFMALSIQMLIAITSNLTLRRRSVIRQNRTSLAMTFVVLWLTTMTLTIGLVGAVGSVGA